MFALLSCVVVLSTSQSETPIEAQFLAGMIPIAINARVGGVERRVMLSTTRAKSYVPGAPGAEVEVSLNGKVLAKVPAGGEAPKLGSLEAVLGLDVLKEMAIGLDLFSGRVTLWTKGGLKEDVVKTWIDTYPAPSGESRPSVKVLTPERIGDAMAFPVGDEGNLALFHLGKVGTVIGEGGPALAGSVVKEAVHRLSVGLTIAGRETPWLGFLYGRDAGWKEFPKATGMSITADALRSRRLLIDLPASKIYIEDLSPDARLSWTLTEWLNMPYRVKGDTILLEGLPGMAWRLPGNEKMKGSVVREIAGLSSSEFLALLRSPTASSRNRLSESFSLRQDYEVKLQTPSGEALTFRMKQPKAGG